MNSLFTGIDISSKTNVVYLMEPDGSKHSSFSVQNNQSGAKILSERIVSALSALQLEAVVIGNGGHIHLRQQTYLRPPTGWQSWPLSEKDPRTQSKISSSMRLTGSDTNAHSL